MSGKIEDLKDERVPNCLYWSRDDVAEWIEDLGFPQYKECFLSNLIDGKKLIIVDASTLPCLGVKDFEHIKVIAKNIRDILSLDDPEWNRSISLPPRESIGMYLERKSQTGQEIGSLSYSKYMIDFKDMKWNGPLTNHGMIQPQD